MALMKDIGLAANIYGARRYPVSLVHFVLNRCNARCSFCFIDFDDAVSQRQQPRLEDIEKIARSAGPHLRNVNLTGGEPFLRKDLSEIAQTYLREAGVGSVFITTNGGYPDRIERFLDSVTRAFPDRKIILSFSIDGVPERHDAIRHVPKLFEKCMRSYRLVRDWGGRVDGNVAITVSPENHGEVEALYDILTGQYGVRALTGTAVRDEGVFRLTPEQRKNVHTAYSALTRRIVADLRSGALDGYDQKSMQGRMMNRKNEIMFGILRDTYDQPRFVSPCRAGSLFGVITADNKVYPCEILDKSIGNLEDFDFDFMRLWRSAPAEDMRRWIVDSKCHCSYECAWSFNILGNARYFPTMAKAALGIPGREEDVAPPAEAAAKA